MRVPPDIIADSGSRDAEYLVLEFWHGNACVGSCKLPISKIRQAAACQVRLRRALCLKE